MDGSHFIFHSVDALYYNLNKISLSRGGSYIDPPEWLKNKKAMKKLKKILKEYQKLSLLLTNIIGKK